MVQSFGVFQDYYSRVYLTEHTASEISWIGSCQVSLIFALGFPTGKLYDIGYLRYLIGTGSLIYLFSVFMLSLSQPHHYYQPLLSQGIGMGIGMGLIFLPALSVPAQYFQRKRSFAMGTVVAGSSLGGIVWPIMLNHLLNGSAGFAWGVRISGFVALFLLSYSFLVMRTRPQKQGVDPSTALVSYSTLLTDAPYLIAVAGMFFGFWGLFFPFFYLQLFANLHEVPKSLTIYIIPILNGASLFGRIIPNFVADRYGRFNVIILMTATSGVLMFAMLGAGSTHGVIIFAIFYGFFSGSFMSLVAPTIGTFSKSAGDVGIRLGFACFIWSFALLTGNPISGALLQSPHYHWPRAIVFNAVMVLFGCLLMLVSRHAVAKQRGTQYV